MTNTLLDIVSSPENLLLAWGKLNKVNKLSHGIDDVTIQDFADNLDDKISSISKSLKDHNYAFSPNRAVLIPKSNGKFRPLQVPIIADRLVLKAIAIELENQFDELISKSEGVSFAYQKKLGVRDAVYKIKEHHDNGNQIVLEADLINFFGEVDKNELLNRQVFPGLKDKSLNDLIGSALNQEIGGLDNIKRHQLKYFENLNNGIPQGNPLSPLLSNIYLSPFDIYLKNKGYNLVRYADDFVILCKEIDDCHRAFNDCKDILSRLKLKIHPLEENGKTKIVDLKQDSFDFLSITFDGKNYYPSEENVNRFKSKIRDICNGKVEYNVLSLLQKISNVFDGWLSAFYYTQVERYEEEIDYYINRQVFLALNKFHWKFTPTSKGKLPAKYRHDQKSADCLSMTQREKSGIPRCSNLLKQKRNESQN